MAFLFASAGVIAGGCQNQDGPSASRDHRDSLAIALDAQEERLASRFGADVDWEARVRSINSAEVYTLHVHQALVVPGEPVSVRARVVDVAPFGGQLVVVLEPDLFQTPQIYFELAATAEMLAPLVAQPLDSQTEIIVAVARIEAVRRPVGSLRPFGIANDEYSEIALEVDIPSMFVARGHLLAWERAVAGPLWNRVGRE